MPRAAAGMPRPRRAWGPFWRAVPGCRAALCSPHTRAAELGGLLGEELAGALRAGLRAFGRRLPGYTAPEAVLTGLETRTSSPVRLARGEGLESPELPGVYPCGEGAGYAGGIMSAAVDGVRAALAIAQRYRPAGQ